MRIDDDSGNLVSCQGNLVGGRLYANVVFVYIILFYNNSSNNIVHYTRVAVVVIDTHTRTQSSRRHTFFFFLQKRTQRDYGMTRFDSRARGSGFSPVPWAAGCLPEYPISYFQNARAPRSRNKIPNEGITYHPLIAITENFFLRIALPPPCVRGLKK